MSTQQKEIQSEAVTQLAQKIIDDIRLRGMSPGDRYLTSEEVRQTFGVGKGVMNRAMQLLSQQKVFVRRPRVGTLIGPEAPVKPKSAIKTIHALLPADRKDIYGFPFDLMVNGLRESIPESNVQFSFVPVQDGMQYVSELISGSQSTGQCYGVISISGDTKLNNYLADIGVPAVAWSSYSRDEGAIPSIDLDLHEGGRLLTQYLIDRGHKRIALLSAAESRAGDNEFFDGVSKALTAARLPHDALIFRLLSSHKEAIQSETHRLMNMENRPTAFIGRVGGVAEAIADAVSSLGMNVPEDAEVVFIDHATAKTKGSALPYVCPTLGFEQMTATTGQMLQRLNAGELLEQSRILIPVHFCHPNVQAAGDVEGDESK